MLLILRLQLVDSAVCAAQADDGQARRGEKPEIDLGRLGGSRTGVLARDGCSGGNAEFS